MPSDRELLLAAADEEHFERTLARFPGLEREAIAAALRSAAERLPAAASHRSPPAPDGAEPPESRGEASPLRCLRIFSDGAARGNPGPAGAGAVLSTPAGAIVARLGRYLGTQTNNVAEYEGLLLGLREARRLGAREVAVFADSELLVRQLLGVYRVKHPRLKPLFEEARALLLGFAKHEVKHIRRELNGDADEMSNRAIDERMTDGA
ncbi:MAG: ribonuclease HI family protein [Deltaproteobacteria bacterium]